jgi:hypothetical protein
MPQQRQSNSLGMTDATWMDDSPLISLFYVGRIGDKYKGFEESTMTVKAALETRDMASISAISGMLAV